MDEMTTTAIYDMHKDDIENDCTRYQNALASEYIRAWTDGYKMGAFDQKESIEDSWHKKTNDGWTGWTPKDPPTHDVIVTVYDDNCDNPFYYTTNAWYLDGHWISRDDFLCGCVVAWRDFPQPCKYVI